MVNKIILAVLLAICFGCKKKEAVNPVISVPAVTLNPGKPNNEHISVLTQHNNNTRAGLNNNETVLTITNVNSKQFGQLFSLPVDDEIYAQPLVFANLSIGSGQHNVVFIATVNNTIYAYDGDNGNLYWKKNFTTAGMRPPNSTDVASTWCHPYQDITFNMGILGTPVIDSIAKTIYFVARSTDGIHNFVQYLHAVNIITGSEQPGSPVMISASVPGTGDGNLNGVVSFDPRRNNQRQALTLVNGMVYMSWSSHCDWNPYHGWILGYDAKTLQQKIVYNDTPNGESGGLWESGQGLAADAAGNLYVVSGNGTVGKNTYTKTDNGTYATIVNTDPSDLTNRGESAMKLTPAGTTLQVTSFFTPSNYYNLEINDRDYGVMGAFIIPNSNYFVTGCKDGNLYLLNKDNMGGYSPQLNMILQTIPLTANITLHCQPSYYKSSSSEFVYVWSENDQLRAFAFNNGQLATNPVVSPIAGPVGESGADLSVSSNGTIKGTGILWASYGTSRDAGGAIIGRGILRAFDANDITKELWNSDQVPGDAVGYYAKFCSPTIANGHVYMASFSKQVIVYGLK